MTPIVGRLRKALIMDLSVATGMYTSISHDISAYCSSCGISSKNWMR